MPESLNSRVAQFEADITLAHQLVHADGGHIQTENGPLRTFAQLQADLEAELNAEVTMTSAAQSMLAAEQAATAAQTTVAETQSALARIAADLIRTQTLVTEHHAFS